MTDEIWLGFRLINFTVLFIAFILMIYKGALNLAIGGKLEWDRMLNLAWVILAIYSIGEVLYMSTGGGLRIFAQTAVAFMQLYVIVFRFKPEEESK